jgi:hypothetical protein
MSPQDAAADWKAMTVRMTKIIVKQFRMKGAPAHMRELRKGARVMRACLTATRSREGEA